MRRHQQLPIPFMPLLLAATLMLVATGRLSAQHPADHLQLGIAAAVARAPGEALAHFRAVLARDSANYAATWRAAMALVDLGTRTPDSVRSPRRDSLYALAESYARRAVAADSAGADGHFALAVAIGRTSLTKSNKERIRRAAEIRSEALRAIALNPRHDGVYHVLGRWNAEIMRLSGLSRFFAKNFLGGGIFGKASWGNAIAYLRQAVRLNPRRIYHHLDLAEVYIDRKRWAEARAELTRVRALPATAFMDGTYKANAARFLDEIADK